MADPTFKPALIVVDMQEDFCPPNGSLAVANGRDVVHTINALLALPSFTLRVATKDWHPANHISFASNHSGKQPFTDFTTVVHPSDPEQKYGSRLWPVHCVQDTPGAALLPELDVAKVDVVIEKGTDSRVEMYSAFYDPLKVCDTGLVGRLREEGVTHVYVVGLAADYCVKSTAVDAKKEGFETYMVEEGTRAVDATGWEECRRKIEETGVRVVSWDGPEVRRLREMSKSA